jgi:hypothetical protein
MKLLDRLTSIAILLLCTAVGADLIYRDFIHPAAAVQAAGARPQPFKAGETFPSLAGLKHEDGKSSLLLVVRSTCRFCKDSVPFYQALVQQVHDAKAPVQVVGVCLESDKACHDYFAQTGVPVDVTIGAPNGLERIEGTPTIVMLDPRGKVTGTWVGALQEDRQKAVLAAATKIG